MSNFFSPQQQNEQIDTKLTFALERIGTLLKNNLQQIAKQLKLTPLQAQLILFISSHDAEKNNVTALAKEFAVTKATISDSLRVLVEKGYLDKVVNANDSRAFHLLLTAKGKDTLKLLTSESNNVKDSLTDLTATQKEQLLIALQSSLFNLQQQGQIPMRMCKTCHYYQAQPKQAKAGFHCGLMKKDLEITELRLDCPEHFSRH